PATHRPRRSQPVGLALLLTCAGGAGRTLRSNCPRCHVSTAVVLIPAQPPSFATPTTYTATFRSPTRTGAARPGAVPRPGHVRQAARVRDRGGVPVGERPAGRREGEGDEGVGCGTRARRNNG